jgi:hypothetical protein
MSRYDDAMRHFEDALKANEQIRSPLLVAHTQHDYAHMLLTRGRPRDNDKALELLGTRRQARPLMLKAEAAGPPPAVSGWRSAAIT